MKQYPGNTHSASIQTNVLVIVFSSPLRCQRAARLPSGDPEAVPHKSLRKAHSDFGSYLGARPHAVKMGVYLDVVLDLPENSWFGSKEVSQQTLRDCREESGSQSPKTS
jgi:hypothetical protein